MKATVYLIHLDRKMCHAQHYLGYTALDSVQERLARHKNGSGAVMLKSATAQGITFDVVREWSCVSVQSAKALERKLKARHNSPKLCPICEKFHKRT